MLENGKINLRQFTILVFVFIIGSSILIVPSGLAVEAKQDAWIAAIVGVGIGILLLILYSVIGKRFPDKNLAEYSEIVLGKWLGKTVSFLFFSFFFILAALVLRNIGDFVITVIMPQTPIESIHILFLSIAVMAVRLGLETFARAAEIFLPWVIMLFVFLVIFVLPDIDFTKMQPVLEEGFKPVIKASVPFIGTPFLELVIFLMIFPYVNQTNRGQKAFMTGVLLGGMVIIMITFLSIAVLGADLTARNIYPSYVLSKKISIANFLERLEALMAGIWFITIFFKLTVCFYASVLGLAQTLNLKDYRALIMPLGMIMLVLSIVAYPNMVYFMTFVSKIWTPYALTYGLFFPLLILGISIFRKDI